MAALSNIVHYIAPVVPSFRVRRITVRHVFLVLGVSGVLSMLYYDGFLKRDRLLSSSEDVIFWPNETPEVWAERAAQVKEAFRYAYTGYERYAYPNDELLPLSNGSINNFNGWGVTAVDSLDTMLLMGFVDEYKRAMPLIHRSNFSNPNNVEVPFFETVIRHLGGMLAAYALSGHDLLRDKADELGRKLAPAFNTKSGFPAFSVNTYTGQSISYNPRMKTQPLGVLAEIASCQLEYAYLGKITGKKEHVDRATLITDILYNANLSRYGGMYPTTWNLFSGTPSNRSTSFSVGALADSGHEYTLKQFLLTARTDKRNLEMYIRFTLYVINNLLFLTPNRNLLYVTDASVIKLSPYPSHQLEHLACFFPGLLALGVHLLPLNHLDSLGIDVASLANDLLPADRQAYADLAEFNLTDLHLWAAEGLAQTCYLTYADQPTGLGPEIAWMVASPQAVPTRWMVALRDWKKEQDRTDKWWKRDSSQYSEFTRPPPGVGDIKPWTSPLPENATIEAMMRHTESPRVKIKSWSTYGRDYVIRDSSYFLRPETVESLYILWKTTGDVKWRHRGWHIFQAIERYTKTASGYASVQNVHTKYPTHMNSMPSYFLAETLKYLYLLFLDEDPLPLDKWVYSTEAHALPVFEWTKEERGKYGIV